MNKSHRTFTVERHLHYLFLSWMILQSVSSLSSTPSSVVVTRRDVLWISSSLLLGNNKSSSTTTAQSILTDPNSYSSLLYQPSSDKTNDNKKKNMPLIVFLHGAGENAKNNIWDLADVNGQYGGLLPSLIESNQAPSILMNEFVVLSPYCSTSKSFYDEPRSKVLSCIQHAIDSLNNKDDGINIIDPSRVFLMGFSDGATLSVELLTTRRFRAGVICSYGFTGKLPEFALERLEQIPLWVFHSADDVIFPITQTSDALVQTLRRRQQSDIIIKYSRFDRDPENMGDGPARGHTTGITASKDPKVYNWLLSLSALQ